MGCLSLKQKLFVMLSIYNKIKNHSSSSQLVIYSLVLFFFFIFFSFFHSFFLFSLLFKCANNPHFHTVSKNCVWRRDLFRFCGDYQRNQLLIMVGRYVDSETHFTEMASKKVAQLSFQHTLFDSKKI